MTRYMFALLPLLWSATALAQDTAPAPGLRTSALSTVYVRDEAGVETAGKLLRLDSTSVVMLVDGREREFDLGHVWSVQKRGDSLKNGAIIGSVAGLGMGLLGGAIADCSNSSGHIGGCGAGTRIAFAVMSTALYGSVGVGIDALIQGRTTLYQRPMMSSASLAPSRGAAVRFAVRWEP